MLFVGILLDVRVYKCFCVCLYTYGDGLGSGKCYLCNSTLMHESISTFGCAYMLMEKN